MESLLLKIETTGLDAMIDDVVQILFVDLYGNIIYNKCFYSDNPSAFSYNGLPKDILKSLPPYRKDDIQREINSFVKNFTIYSFNKEFDESFLEVEPSSWLNIMDLLPKRRRIPNLDCYKSIPNAAYRKSLNILSLMKDNNLLPEEEIFSLSF
jgi:DNA polymerase III alpha subunit (gram-positive type)